MKPSMFKRQLHSGLSAFLLIMIVSVLSSCNQKTISVTTPSYQSGDTSFAADSLQGYVFMPDSKVKLRSIHDNDSLRLEIKIDDRLTLRSVLTNGLSVWIDPKSQKTQTYGIAFPAARAEMFKRRDEIVEAIKKLEEDSVPAPVFSAQTWVDGVNQRDAVIKDIKGTRFAEKNIARVFLDEEGSLHYYTVFSFSQLGISPDADSKAGIGIISQVHQAVNPQGGGTGAAPGNPAARPRNTQQSAPAAHQQLRIPQVPVNSWIVILIGENAIKARQDEITQE